MRRIVEVGAGAADVTVPVALLHDDVLVAVERACLLLKRGQPFRQVADSLQQPKRCYDGEDKSFSQFFLDDFAEFPLCVALAVAQHVSAAAYSRLQCVENGCDEVADVDKRQFLPAETDAEIESGSDGLHHQEVVALMRAVDACRTQGDVGEILQ